MMHHSDGGTSSDTTTRGGNSSYGRCKGCGYELMMCTCWYELMDRLDKIIAIKAKLDIYKFLIKKSVWIRMATFIRRTPTSISGMKGLKLLERMDKI